MIFLSRSQRTSFTGWLLALEFLISIGLFCTLGAQLILAGIVTRYPLEFILRQEYLLITISFIASTITSKHERCHEAIKLVRSNEFIYFNISRCLYNSHVDYLPMELLASWLVDVSHVQSSLMGILQFILFPPLPSYWNQISL